MSKSRNISTGTIKSLYAHSGNKCAFTNCSAVLVYDENVNISNICHIYGLNPNSARYKAGLSNDFLNSEGNLILLCPTHHKLIDSDQRTYTVETLIQMKRSQEERTQCIGVQFNEGVKNIDYKKALQYYQDNFAIYELTEKDMQSVADEFSRYNPDVKNVMFRILDEVKNESNNSIMGDEYSFNMNTLVYQMLGDKSVFCDIIAYLLEIGYIWEALYTGYNDQSFMIIEDGSFFDLSKNIGYRIKNGRWSVAKKGQIVDAIYRTNGYI